MVQKSTSRYLKHSLAELVNQKEETERQGALEEEERKLCEQAARILSIQYDRLDPTTPREQCCSAETAAQVPRTYMVTRRGTLVVLMINLCSYTQLFDNSALNYNERPRRKSRKRTRKGKGRRNRAAARHTSRERETRTRTLFITLSIYSIRISYRERY